MATCTIADAGGVWTDNATWVEGTAPTNADEVVATATSGNVTISANGVCRSADFTGYVGTLTHNNGVDWLIGDATAGTGNVALKFVPGMTYSPGSATARILFPSSSATQQTVTTAGKTMGAMSFTGVGGNYLLADAVTCTGVFTHLRGTFNTGNFSIACARFACSGTNTRTLTLGSSTVTISAGTTAAWDFTTTTNLTFNSNTSHIVFTGATQTLVGGGQTFNNVSFTGVGPYIITGANTFATLRAVSAGGEAAKSLTFPAGATTTATTFELSGRPNALLSIQSSSAASAATLSQAAGTVRLRFVNVQDITVTGGATWIAYGGTNVSGNTDLTFFTWTKGEELQAALNRLAGTSGLDATGAANVLAGTSRLELVGALNAYAGTTGLELAGVLAYLGRNI